MTTPPNNPTSTHHHALARAVRAVSGVTLLSRIGGLIRDSLLARVFGATALGSAFTAAFAIPNMFRRLFGEGALSAAFIPAYTGAEKQGRAQADALASLTIAALGLITSVLTVLIIGGLLIVLALTPMDYERDLSLMLIIVMIPFMPLICIAAILAGMLQVHGRFGPASTGPLSLNLFMVVVCVYFLFSHSAAGPMTAFVLGGATVLSGLTQVLWFRKLLRPHFQFRRDWRIAYPAAKAMFRKFVPVAIGLGTLQLNAFIDTLIAMYPIWVGPTLLGFVYPLDEASTIIVRNAMPLYQFPLGVFGIAVATAVFPMLARHAAEAHGGAVPFLDTLRRGLRLSLLIGLPSSLGLMFVGHDLISLAYGSIGSGARGFDPEAVNRCYAVLVGFAPGVWAYGLNHVLTRAFYARGDTTTPMRISIAMMLLNLALNLGLIWVLREAGLAWATSIAAIVQTVVLGSLLHRRLTREHPEIGPLIDRATISGMLRVLAASILMALCVGLVVWFMGPIPGFAGWVARVIAATVTGAATYYTACKLLKSQELRWLFARKVTI